MDAIAEAIAINDERNDFTPCIFFSRDSLATASPSDCGLRVIFLAIYVANAVISLLDANELDRNDQRPWRATTPAKKPKLMLAPYWTNSSQSGPSRGNTGM